MRSEYESVRQISENLYALAKTNGMFMFEDGTTNLRQMTLAEWRAIHGKDTKKRLNENHIRSQYKEYLMETQRWAGRVLSPIVLNEISNGECVTCAQKKMTIMERLIVKVKEAYGRGYTTLIKPPNAENIPKSATNKLKKKFRAYVDDDYEEYADSVVANADRFEREPDKQDTAAFKSKNALKGRVNPDDWEDPKEKEAEEAEKEAEEALDGLDLDNLI